MENIFADGIFAEKPSDKAPSFLKAKVSINVDQLIPFISKHKNGAGYVNLDLKESKGGKLYFSLNEYKKGTLKDPNEAEMPPVINLEEEVKVEPLEDIPF